MASAIGDLVAIAGIDSTKWVQGCIDIQNATRNTTSSVNQNFAGMGAGAGRNIAQIGFAVQDFTSVLEGGGKNALGRALMSTMNNIQMLGAMFGPWGMALTAVGGALGSMLIPKLLEGETAAKSFSSSIKDTMKSLDDLSTKEASFGSKMIGISHVDKSSTMKERIADIDAEMAIAKASRERAKGALSGLLDEGVRLGHLTVSKAGVDAITGMPGVEAGKGMFGDATSEGAAAKTAYDEAFKALKAMHAAERTLSDVRFTSVRKLGELEASERVKVAEKNQNNALQRAHDAIVDRAERASKIVEMSRSKADIGVDRINEISDFFQSGLITQEQAEKAAKDATRDAAEKRTGNLNTAAIGGTAQGFAALQQSLKEGRDSPQVKQLEIANTNLRLVIAAINQNKPPPQPVPVGIN